MRQSSSLLTVVVVLHFFVTGLPDCCSRHCCDRLGLDCCCCCCCWFLQFRIRWPMSPHPWQILLACMLVCCGGLKCCCGGVLKDCCCGGLKNCGCGGFENGC